jgi:cyclophilin family peptidyl-prolyl cis-trans isomerase/HEAT repeat protein
MEMAFWLFWKKQRVRMKNKNTSKIRFLYTLVLVISIDLSAQHLSMKERDILQLQDQRLLGDGKLVSYLTDIDPQVRYRAAVAIANIQDTSTLTALSISIQDNNARVRSVSAFALGQIGSEKSIQILFAALNIEKETQVVVRLAEALGKCGSAKYLDSILAFALHTPKSIPPRDLALTLARFAIRQIKSERSIWKCFELLKDSSQIVQAHALYALWRSAPSGLTDLEISKSKEELLRLTHDRDAEVRMNLAILLGKSKSKDAKEILDSLEAYELNVYDWHVLVQIARSYANVITANGEIIKKLSFYLMYKNDHVKIASLQSCAALPKEVIKQSEERDSIRLLLIGLLNSNSVSESVKGEVLVALGKHFPVDLDQYLSWMTDQDISSRIKAKLLEGMSQRIDHKHIDFLLQHLTHENVRVTMSAWDFLRRMVTYQSLSNLNLDSTSQNELFHKLFKKAKSALSRKDIGITTVVANLFADTSIFISFKKTGLSEQLRDAFISSYESFIHPDDSEAKQSILQALGTINNATIIPFLEQAMKDSNRTIALEAAAALLKITGKDLSHNVPLVKIIPISESEWNLFDQIKTQQNIQIETTKGMIVLELRKECAPITVLRLFQLVKHGFYNGLFFHRVVPDFVVQGGDPRGDGWGGPGYSMRTEVALINYESGSCGMASAGKDTEGCQFFITHVSTPHLDGRYTIFGKVVKGMEVVDSLQVGDRIHTMQVVE